MSKDLTVFSDAILHIENVNRTYYDDADNQVEALHNINLSVY
ncbi:MAG TPA: ABC transporter ATP-binding protein, partial [Bacteroides graminisolvens]|nr:ABC transporter ATP-binding protein [Bacteroides graminisolvens]